MIVEVCWYVAEPLKAAYRPPGFTKSVFSKDVIIMSENTFRDNIRPSSVTRLSVGVRCRGGLAIRLQIIQP